MKGMIFGGFLKLVEDKYGLQMVDYIIENSDLKTNGAYTSVGKYEFSEMLQLLQNLSNKVNISIDDLLLVYGEYFFEIILEKYSFFLKTFNDPIQMLSSIENHIHVEVLKIYPDSELPTFEVVQKNEKSLIMIYKSDRAMHHFGLGLMNKTFEYFNSKANIILEKIKEDGTEVKFIITKND
jgi:hypothetical protein